MFRSRVGTGPLRPSSAPKAVERGRLCRICVQRCLDRVGQGERRFRDATVVHLRRVGRHRRWDGGVRLPLAGGARSCPRFRGCRAPHRSGEIMLAFFRNTAHERGGDGVERTEPVGRAVFIFLGATRPTVEENVRPFLYPQSSEAVNSDCKRSLARLAQIAARWDLS